MYQPQETSNEQRYKYSVLSLRVIQQNNPGESSN